MHVKSYCSSRDSRVPMLMMDVWVMWMPVRDRFVRVWMCMRFASVPGEIVRMLVMQVVYVKMGMGDRLVGMQMLVALSQM